MANNNLDLNINDIKRNNPYDVQLAGQSPNPSLNNGFLKAMPWLVDGNESVSTYANRNIPFFGGDRVPEDFGESQFDENIPWNRLEYESLNDIRAERQPWYDQAANALVKFGVITGTTFADNFLGTAVGLLNVGTLINDYDEDLNFFENLGSRFFDNPYSRNVTVGLQDAAEEAFPVYANDEFYQNQEEGNWHKNLGWTWVAQNLPQMGFTAGTILGGTVQAGAINKLLNTGVQRDVLRNYAKQLSQTDKWAGVDPAKIERNLLRSNFGSLPEEVAAAVNSLKVSGAVSNGIGLATSTFGEARVESIHSAEEFVEQQKQNLDSLDSLQNIQKQASDNLAQQGIGIDTPNYEELLNQESQRLYDDAQNRIESEARRLVALDGALNIPILTASSALTFGRVFSSGFSTQRGFLTELKAQGKKAILGEQSNAIEGAGRIIHEGERYALKNSKANLIKDVGNVFKPIVSEGLWEEMMQGAISKAAQQYSAGKLNTFFGYKFDPEVEQDLISRLDAIFQGIQDTYTNWENYEEGFVGGLFGALGSVNVKPRSNGIGFRPTWSGGVYEEIQANKERNQSLLNTVEALNSRLADPEFLNYYQGLIRHNSLQEDKDEAIIANDEFTFKNADHAQFISDIIMFDKAGRLEDLIEVLDNALDETSNLSPEDIARKATQLRELTRDSETGAEMYTNKTDEEVVNESNEFVSGLKAKLNDYREVSSNLQQLYGDVFEDGALEELTYTLSQINDWENRFNSLNETVKSQLRDVRARGLNMKKFEVSLPDSEGNLTNQRLTLSEFLDRADAIDIVSNIQTNEALRKVIDNEVIKQIKKQTPNADEIVKNVNDLTRISVARKDFIQKFNDFIQDPSTLNNSISTDLANAETTTTRMKDQDLIDTLNNATDLANFKAILNEEPNSERKNRVLDKMSIKDNPEYNSLAVDFKKLNNFDDWYGQKSAALQEAEVTMPEETTNAAKELLRDKIINAPTFNDLLNSPVQNTKNYPDNVFNEVSKLINDILGEYKKLNNIAEASNQVFNKSNNQVNNTQPQNTPTNIDEPIGAIDSNQLKTISNNTVALNDTRVDKIDNNLDKKARWDSGVWEIELDTYKESFRLESRNDPTYKDAADYLEANGAFEYVNRGNLQVGDDVYLAYDPAYVNLNDWTRDKRPLVFIKKLENGSIQIIGTFNTYNNFPLHNTILENYDNLPQEQREALEVNNSIYISDYSVKVTEVMPGRIGIIRDNERPLSEILDTKLPDGSNVKVLFGVSINGNIETNTEDNIINVIDTDDNNGRLYFGVRDSNGNYIPAAVRVKRFNDVDLNNTELGKQLDRALISLAQSANQGVEQFNDQIHNLRNFLYVGGKSSTRVNLIAGNQGNVIEIRYRELDTNNENTLTIPVIENNEELANQLRAAFKVIKAPIQINKNDLNGKWNSVDNTKNYNKILLDANILTSNLQLPYIRGAYFYTQALDEDFKPIEPIEARPKPVSTNVSNNNVGTSENAVGREVTFNNNKFTIQEDGSVYKDNTLVTNERLANNVRNQVATQEQQTAPEEASNDVWAEAANRFRNNNRGTLTPIQQNIRSDIEQLLNSLNPIDVTNRTTTYRNVQLVVLPDGRVYNRTNGNLVDTNTAFHSYAVNEYNKFLSLNQGDIAQPSVNNNNETIPVERPRRTSRLCNSLFDVGNNDNNETSQQEEIDRTKQYQDRECPETITKFKL